jgi:hypothetical protein
MYQVAVDSVAHGSSAGLDLDEDTQFVVNGIDLVGDDLGSLIAKENRPSHGVRPTLAHLDQVAEEFEPWPQLPEDLVATNTRRRSRVDLGAAICDDGHEVGRPGRRP